jgi:DNA-binding beta-propeller fold protein YncE
LALGIGTEVNRFTPTRRAGIISNVLVATVSLFPFSLLLSSGSDAFATAGTQFYQVTGVVPLGIVPDPDNSKLYLINYNKSITVVAEDDPTNVIAQINNPDYEEGEFSFTNLALNPLTHKLYLVSENSQGIYVIDGQTDRIVKRIDLSTWGVSIAVNSVTNKIYAFGYGDILHVIDGFSDEIEDTIDVGQYIRDSVGRYDSLVTAEVTVNPNTNTIYTLHHLSNLILAINGTNNEIIRNTTSVERPFAMLLNYAVDKLYVSANPGLLTILDGSSLEVISTINGVGYGGAIPSMWRGIGPSGYTIYVPSGGGENVAMWL